MLQTGGRNPSMKMTDDARGGYLQITLRRPSQYISLRWRSRLEQCIPCE
ncbi:hypothetical protein A2U01_0067150, partial [Trifolium medium]|nr:hypothetical protein [Trifolium medium]